MWTSSCGCVFRMKEKVSLYRIHKFIVRHHIVASQSFFSSRASSRFSPSSSEAVGCVLVNESCGKEPCYLSLWFFDCMCVFWKLYFFLDIISCAGSLYTRHVLLWNAGAHNVSSDCSSTLLQQSRTQVFHSQLISSLEPNSNTAPHFISVLW